MNASVRLRVEIGIGKTETQGLERRKDVLVTAHF